MFPDVEGPFMPELVRDWLPAVVRERFPERVEALVQSAANAMASTGDVDAARRHCRLGALLERADLLLRKGIITEEQREHLRLIPAAQVIADPRPTLTAREQEVPDLLRQGLSRKEMAKRSYRSENTVQGQLRTLYSKLGANSSKEALDRARLYGL